MVSINYATREVTCKIVYYGPGLSGKTTNLIYIHKKVPSNTKGKMISLATEADRTLYFDFLPINIGTISGFAAKFQLYTVPGQVYYNATRKLVLRGVDGLVFVADSQADKMDENIESLNNLRENLEEYGYNIDDIPCLIQYNKRDLDNILPVAELEKALNTKGWKSFEASAVEGTGVFDTLKAIIKLVLDKARSTQSSKPREASIGQEKATVKAVAGQVPEAREEAAAKSDGEQPGETIPESGSESPRQPVYDAEGESRPVDEVPPVEAGIITGNNYIPASDEEAPPAAERDQAETSERPYPGSTGKISRRERRISVADFQPGARTEERSEEESGGTDRFRGDSEVRGDLPSPTMAPSNRIVKKKRGFFKRLFGIK